MRRILLACLLVAAMPVSLARIAPARAQADPATGARPGNVIGTGQSLPLSGAASNATAADTTSIIAPRLPMPSIGDDAKPRGFLEDAERALTLGRTGEAQEALERAESRLLDRDVAPSAAGRPSGQTLVTMVGDARRALAAGDRATALRLIGQAIQALPQ